MRRPLAGLLLGTFVYGCTLAVDLDELDNHKCPSGQKLCNDACVSTKDPIFGCGSAGCSSCNLQYAHAKCSEVDGSCQIAACDGTNRRDCDGVAANGCERDLSHDPQTCGSCTAAPCVVANGTPTCTSGKCAVLSCKSGYSDCNKMASDGCETGSGTCP
ncbi:MAG: hypothetical protein QM756_06295 [Polyangiaceae bacterium]